MFGFGRAKKATAAVAVNCTNDLPTEQRSLSNPDPWLYDIFGAVPSLSNITITPRSRPCVLPPSRPPWRLSGLAPFSWRGLVLGQCI